MKLLLAFALATAWRAAAAATIGGVEMPGTLQVGERVLVLASCGVRDSLWIDHYAAGLYLPSGETTRAVQDQRRAKAVRLHVIEARFLPDRIPEKWRTALNRELAEEPMLRVRAWYEKLSDGDQITFAYRPGEGTTMQVNGRTVVQTPGHAVLDSILKAWAAKDPVSGKLQRLALEHPC